MFSRPIWLAAVVAVAVLSPRASADTISLTLNDGGTSVSFKDNGAATTVNGGPFHWTQTSPVNSNYATSVTTYCIDLDKNIAPGSTYTYTVQTDLTQAPTIGTAAKAAAITELFNQYYKESLGSAADAAAFQLALWELVYDGASSPSLGTGRIQGTNSEASQMLSTLGNGTGSDLDGSHLVVLLSGNAQDQIMVVPDSVTPPPSGVPAPPGVVLAGLGFGGLMLGRFRRAK